MSYCRWSSDDYQSDVYCYANVSGAWTTHVAGRRYTFTGPLPPPVEDDGPLAVQRWMERHEAVRALLGPLVEIGLPHDGETFDDPTPQAMHDRLTELRALGYRVPEYALERLREEVAEQPTTEEEE